MTDTNEPIPADFKKQVQARFDKLTTREVTLDEFLARETSEFQHQRALAANLVALYLPATGTITPCGNGDLELLLDPAEWQGGSGLRPSVSCAPINFGGLAAGLNAGAINSPTAHQTWVAAGLDPNVGIPTTAQGSAGAVRIGNAVNGWGCELLSKTFIVTPVQSTITFWYAVVLQDPGHPQACQPFFQVRVTDSSGNVVPGAFDFGNGSDTVIADHTNPFFQTKGDVVYKDWGCAQIDLSSQVGKQVTVEFVTADCGFGGHWGYAYIDSFCGNCKGSPTGNITYDCEQSTHCGPGKICFNYSLPQAGGTTGTVMITLDIYQNGTLLTQLTSPVLSSGTSFCFNITPASIPGINLGLGGFDFAATAAFVIGSTSLGHIKVGTAPDGITPGKNNDYQIACKSCEEIERDQDAYLKKKCAKKMNLLPRTSCDCPDTPSTDGECRCDCRSVAFPDIKPCISVAWGDSKCDCLETDDIEVVCVTVCNCYSNVTFSDLTIGQIQVTDTAGNPVPTLPDGTPSVQVIPSGPICFGDIGPCKPPNQPGCVSRELVIYTRGAVGKDYKLSFSGVCFSVKHEFQSEQCFLLKLCQD